MRTFAPDDDRIWPCKTAPSSRCVLCTKRARSGSSVACILCGQVYHRQCLVDARGHTCASTLDAPLLDHEIGRAAWLAARRAERWRWWETELRRNPPCPRPRSA